MRVIILYFIFSITFSSVNAQTLSFESVVEVKPLKRGNTYQLSWTGGIESDRIVVELIKDNQTFRTWEQSDNQGKAAIKLPTNLKPADNYYFRIYNRNNNSFTTSDMIEIRRKIPLSIKLVGITAIPLAIIILTSTKGEDYQLPSPATPPRN